MNYKSSNRCSVVLTATQSETLCLTLAKYAVKTKGGGITQTLSTQSLFQPVIFFFLPVLFSSSNHPTFHKIVTCLLKKSYLVYFSQLLGIVACSAKLSCSTYTKTPLLNFSLAPTELQPDFYWRFPSCPPPTSWGSYSIPIDVKA